MSKKRNTTLGPLLALSTALHLPLTPIPETANMLWEKREEIAYVARQKARAFWNKADSETSEKYKQVIRNLTENGEDIDLGDFYLISEYLQGYISEEEKESASKVLEIEVEELMEFKKKNAVKKTLNKMISMQNMASTGERGYCEARSLLSSILLKDETGKRCGNCEARQKLMSTYLQRVFPELPFRHQQLKINGVPHTRLIVWLDGGWYSMELPGLQPVHDFNGTILSDSNDQVEVYSGQKPDSLFIQPGQSIPDASVKELSDAPKKTNTPTVPLKMSPSHFSISDTFLNTSPSLEKGNAQLANFTDEGSNYDRHSGNFEVEVHLIDSKEVEVRRKASEEKLRKWKKNSDVAEARRTIRELLPGMNLHCDYMEKTDSLSEQLAETAETNVENCDIDDWGELSCDEDGAPFNAYVYECPGINRDQISDPDRSILANEFGLSQKEIAQIRSWHELERWENEITNKLNDSDDQVGRKNIIGSALEETLPIISPSSCDPFKIDPEKFNELVQTLANDVNATIFEEKNEDREFVHFDFSFLIDEDCDPTKEY